MCIATMNLWGKLIAILQRLLMQYGVNMMG